MGWNPWNRPFNCFPILETVIIDTWYQLKFGVSLEVTESRFRSIHLQYQALHSSNKIFIKISYWIYTPSSQSYSYNQDTIYYKWATMGQCEAVAASMGCPGYPWISLWFQYFRIRRHISPNPVTYFDILLNNRTGVQLAGYPKDSKEMPPLSKAQ